MLSIKISILALYCLLFAQFAFRNIEFDEKWDFGDYMNGTLGCIAGLLSVILIATSVLIPAEKKKETDETPENITQEVEQDT